MSATDIALFSTIALLVVSNTAGMITMTIYLSSRIDRLGDQLGERLRQVEIAQARLEERMEAGFSELRRDLREHTAQHAQTAHGRG